jgi:hypothetical protein
LALAALAERTRHHTIREQMAEIQYFLRLLLRAAVAAAVITEPTLASVEMAVLAVAVPPITRSFGLLGLAQQAKVTLVVPIHRIQQVLHFPLVVVAARRRLARTQLAQA